MINVIKTAIEGVVIIEWNANFISKVSTKRCIAA